MKYNNLEETLRMFPHWYDKTSDSNFSKTVRVLNNQYLDKYHKIKTLEFAQNLHKPIRISKDQKEPYIYSIIFDVTIPNLQEVNLYINPIINDDEKILSYEKCITKTFKDDGNNTYHHFTYHGDTRKAWDNKDIITAEEYGLDNNGYNEKPKHDIEIEVTDSQGIPIPDALVENNYTLPIIPNDTFIVEAITYDDYRWVKGFPENDIEDLYRIYQEHKSYTDYLTFEIRKQNIKEITILKDNLIIFNQILHKEFETGGKIKHDYQPQQKAQEYGGVLIADPDKENYILRAVLTDEDYERTFDFSQLETNYPNITDDYIFLKALPTPANDTINKIYITKKNNRYNGHITVFEDNEYKWHIAQRDIPFTSTLKSNYDLIIKTYDINHPSCPDYDKQMHKRYNGYDKSNYDCFSHDYSLDMLGKYWNIPRLNFKTTEYENKCEKLSHEYYDKTYPTYNNRLTEDDWNYQKRITTYIQKYNKELFPILELWKNYQVWGKLQSRKDILSVQDQSYLQEYPYYEDTSIREYSRNLLNITKGQANRITIDNHTWHEALICDDIYIIPKTEYILSYRIETTQPLADERVTFHIYYFNDKDECTHEEVHTPIFLMESANIYSSENRFTTREDSYKIDIVLESDNSFSFSNANMHRISIADKNAMYMATKKDYHSCVYDLYVNYNDVPSNIEFNNTQIFEKLLQRSLPVTHKGYLDISYDNEKEELGICEDWGEIKLLNYFDETNNHSTDPKSTYTITMDRMMTEGNTYLLEVTFISETEIDIDDKDKYILTTLEFKDNLGGEVKETMNAPPIIQTNYPTTMRYKFTATRTILDITFHTTNQNKFTYKDLKITRAENIDKTELWEQ